MMPARWKDMWSNPPHRWLQNGAAAFADVVEAAQKLASMSGAAAPASGTNSSHGAGGSIADPASPAADVPGAQPKDQPGVLVPAQPVLLPHPHRSSSSGKPPVSSPRTLRQCSVELQPLQHAPAQQPKAEAAPAAEVAALPDSVRSASAEAQLPAAGADTNLDSGDAGSPRIQRAHSHPYSRRRSMSMPAVAKVAADSGTNGAPKVALPCALLVGCSMQCCRCMQGLPAATLG